MFVRADGADGQAAQEAEARFGRFREHGTSRKGHHRTTGHGALGGATATAQETDTTAQSTKDEPLRRVERRRSRT